MGGWGGTGARDTVRAVLEDPTSTHPPTLFLPCAQNAIHSHIRLFEPLVIKALKQYTTTTSVRLQRQVLDLLAQLVQLRVNYCLLDSDQVCPWTAYAAHCTRGGWEREQQVCIVPGFLFAVPWLSSAPYIFANILDFSSHTHMLQNETEIKV